MKIGEGSTPKTRRDATLQKFGPTSFFFGLSLAALLLDNAFYFLFSQLYRGSFAAGKNYRYVGFLCLAAIIS